MGAVTVENSMEVSQLKIELSYDPVISLQSMYLKTSTTLIRKDSCACTRVHVHTCVRARTHTHTHTHTVEYYSTMKKNTIVPFSVTLMDLEGIKLSEISQRKKNTV